MDYTKELSPWCPVHNRSVVQLDTHLMICDAAFTGRYNPTKISAQLS